MTTNQTTKLMSKPEIKALPEAVQKQLRTFMNSIPKTKWYQPDGKPNPEWRVFYGDTWDSAWASARASAQKSERESTRKSERESAWESERESTRKSAWESTRESAWESTRKSERESAWESTRESAWESAWKSAWESAWDFSLMACMIVVSDLDYPDKKKYEKHVKSLAWT